MAGERNHRADKDEASVPSIPPDLLLEMQAFPAVPAHGGCVSHHGTGEGWQDPWERG